MEEELKEAQAQLELALTQAAAEKVRADSAEEESAKHKERADAAEGEVRALNTRIEKLQKESRTDAVEKLQSEVKSLRILLDAANKSRRDAEDPEKIQKLVKQRVAIMDAARNILPYDFRMDDLTDRQIQVAVIERLDGPVEEKATDAFVSGCFKMLTKGYDQASRALSLIKDRADADAADRDDGDDAEKQKKQKKVGISREEFLERRDNAWKQRHSVVAGEGN